MSAIWYIEKKKILKTKMFYLQIAATIMSTSYLSQLTQILARYIFLRNISVRISMRFICIFKARFRNITRYWAFKFIILHMCLYFNILCHLKSKNQYGDHIIFPNSWMRTIFYTRKFPVDKGWRRRNWIWFANPPTQYITWFNPGGSSHFQKSFPS